MARAARCLPAVVCAVTLGLAAAAATAAGQAPITRPAHHPRCISRAAARRLRGHRHPPICRRRRRLVAAPTATGVTTAFVTTTPLAGQTTPAGQASAGLPSGVSSQLALLEQQPGPAAEGEGSPPVVPHVEVTAVEYHYTLSRTSVPAGKVIIQFVNDGQDEHNLNLLPASGELAGSFPDAASHSVSSQQLVLKAGAYTLFCSLPEHEQKGMKAQLTVE